MLKSQIIYRNNVSSFSKFLLFIYKVIISKQLFCNFFVDTLAEKCCYYIVDAEIGVDLL